MPVKWYKKKKKIEMVIIKWYEHELKISFKLSTDNLNN